VRRRRNALWPASREVRPKQFFAAVRCALDVSGYDHRVSDPSLFEQPIIVTNAAYRFMVLEQLAEVGLRPTFCWSRCDAIPGQRLRPVGLAQPATVRPWCWRSPPITSCAMRAPLLRLPPGARCGRAGTHRHFRVKPERAATEYGYISPGRWCPERWRAVRKIRREADPAQAAIHQGGLSLEQRHFMFPRLRLAR